MCALRKTTTAALYLRCQIRFRQKSKGHIYQCCPSVFTRAQGSIKQLILMTPKMMFVSHCSESLGILPVSITTAICLTTVASLMWPLASSDCFVKNLSVAACGRGYSVINGSYLVSQFKGRPPMASLTVCALSGSSQSGKADVQRWNSAVAAGGPLE